MAKITKRAVDALQSVSGRDVFIWDSELRGFGVRVKPSGVRTFLIQYRNVEGRTRRLVLGQYGALTPENARDLAREKLAGVAKGEDPSAERHAVRAGMSVSDVCDWYLEEAEAGRILGRNRRPIKASTLKMDRSRIETHIKPLLGARLVSGLTLRDIEGMQADIAAGKSARGRKAGRGGKSTGGSGVASRTVGTLRGLLGHAARLKVVGKNPAEGVRQLAVERRQRRLSDDELRASRQYHADPSRRGRTSDRPCRHPHDAAVRVSSNGSVRVGAQLGQPSRTIASDSQTRRAALRSGSSARPQYDVSKRRLDGRARPSCSRPTGVTVISLGSSESGSVCRKANLKEVTPHVLRHTFASVAGDLGFSELTIAGLLGHSARGVTQGYVHLDTALIVAADRVSAEIAKLLDGTNATRKSKKSMEKTFTTKAAA